MANTMHVDIVSAETQLYSGAAERVSVSGIMGDMGIHPQHAPLLTILKPGQVRIFVNNVEEIIYVSGGMLEVQPYIVTILADTAIRARDLDEAAALEAKERAEEELQNKLSELEYSKATAELAQAVAQIKAIQDLRKKYKS